MNLTQAGKAFQQAFEQPRPHPFELIKLSRAAELGGLNPQTLRRRIHRGELRAYGKPWRVRLADVLAEYLPDASEK